jgi:hypothetical protein
VTRRAAEGKTKTEIMRCLKRYIAREVFPTCLQHAVRFCLMRNTVASAESQ